MNTSNKNFIHHLESIKKTIDNFEYWSARELMSVLGYTTWAKFSLTINRAKESFETSKGIITDHFVGAGKVIIAGKGAKHNISDILLTRYACYLIAQNGDPRKPEIAEAQMYFATQTRKIFTTFFNQQNLFYY
jgi:DNA-damage-inducible protein D